MKTNSVKVMNIAGRVPEELRKNRVVCHILEIETVTDKR